MVEHLNSYISEDYKEGTCLPTIIVDGDQELTLRVNLSCHSLNLKNFWGGEWLSTWDIMHTLGSSDYKMVGKIRINNHYFEQGNIRFDLAKNFTSAVEGSVEDGSIGKGIVS